MEKLLNWDFFVVIGMIGQIFFSMRFIVQWIASEKIGKSVIPFSFWIFSLGGSALLLSYALYRKDPVFILGQVPNLFIYSRNIYLIKKKGS
ncbi:lipid-A-disaccharide synthase N-terminal domain-containing protein [Fusobacterium sp.]|uniref:lipid-A-disaccharide synthase N-terminal domain-containing protein n=1 Tax=Fusobacterium sp. TaxID=68766 RepID=UPI0028FFB437|nr:lipid-A-disaccharide synthase N-terminal domain-containing protein [Fusobacterium sp.]MDU1911499.1 lipid-A-disaccharide synthase N-terminal domain-containing protein [Fusobacterium sp.]